MKRWMLAFKIAASLLFIGLLFRIVDLDLLAAYARRADGVYFALSLVCSFLMVAISTWKWWYLQRLQGHPLPFLRLYRWYFVGYFYSNFLPSNVGGDVARAWLAGRASGSPGAAVVSVFAERFTGLIFLLIAAVVLPFTSAGLWKNPAVLFGVLAGAGALFVILMVLLLYGSAAQKSATCSWLPRLKKWLRADQPGRIHRAWNVAETKAGRLAGRLLELGGIASKPGPFWSLVGLTVLFYAMTVLNVALAYRTFGVWPDVQNLAAVLPVALIVAMIPLTLGNLGIAEGAYVFYFGLAGMGKELTLAMSLLLRLKVIILGAVGLVAQASEPLQELPDAGSTNSKEP